jgi:hypothetical protein
MDKDQIARFCQDANNLILEISTYSAQAERSEEDSSEIRRLRTVVASLAGALDSVRSPSMTAAPPIPALR